MKKKILSTYKFDPKPFSVLEDQFEITYPSGNMFGKSEVLNIIDDFDVLITNFSFSVDDELLEQASKLKLIANFGVGYNNINVDKATERGVVVCNTPRSVLEPTAEMCFALMGAVARNVGFFNNKLRTPEGLNWGIYDNLGVSLYNKTLGLLGFGRIGQAVARRAIAAGMNIIYHNRNRVALEIEQKYNAKYVAFDDLLSTSDFVSINVPATTDTYHIIDAEAIGKMKPTAIIVNTSRGSTIDEVALIEALQNKQIFGAGLDVYETEPHINTDFFKLDNVVLTPHAGTQTKDARVDMQNEVVQNILAFYSGGNFSRVN